MIKDFFYMKNENGVVTKYDILITFDYVPTGKSYVIYTDNSRDSCGNILVSAGTYDPDAETVEPAPIETVEEWNMVNVILENVQQNGELMKKLQEETLAEITLDLYVEKCLDN